MPCAGNDSNRSSDRHRDGIGIGQAVRRDHRIHIGQDYGGACRQHNATVRRHRDYRCRNGSPVRRSRKCGNGEILGQRNQPIKTLRGRFGALFIYTEFEPMAKHDPLGRSRSRLMYLEAMSRKGWIIMALIVLVGAAVLL